MQKKEMFARGAEATASYLPPLGLAYIAAFLRKNGHVCEIYDGVVNPIELKTLCNKAQLFGIIGISVVTAYYLRAKELLSILNMVPRRPPIIVGGTHATYRPEDLLKDGADIAVIGEGEYTCLELVNTLEKENFINNLDEKILSNIAGIAYVNKNSEIIKTKKRTAVNLEELPLPARDLLPMHLYGTSIARSSFSPSHSVLTSRGCNGICSFCNHSMF